MGFPIHSLRQRLSQMQEEPDFHTYLQSEVSGQPGLAVFGSYTTAAQFQLNDGQVEQQLANGSVLYLNGVLVFSLAHK